MKAWAVAALTVSSAWFAAQGAAAADGKLIYVQTCAQCHANGLAGAPKIGDKAAWAQRLALGRAAMLTTVLKGKGGMPPKGGNASLSDAEARAATDYMLEQLRTP